MTPIDGACLSPTGSKSMLAMKYGAFEMRLDLQRLLPSCVYAWSRVDVRTPARLYNK